MVQNNHPVKSVDCEGAGITRSSWRLNSPTQRQRTTNTAADRAGTLKLPLTGSKRASLAIRWSAAAAAR
jgi:hypothetical protein